MGFRFIQNSTTFTDRQNGHAFTAKVICQWRNGRLMSVLLTLLVHNSQLLRQAL